MNPGATNAPPASTTVSPSEREPRPDLGDDSVTDAHVGGRSGRARPVDDRAAPDQQISRHALLGDADGPRGSGERQLGRRAAVDQVAGKGTANVGASTSSRSRSWASICQTVDRRERLDPGAVGAPTEHVGVAEDVAGVDLAHRPTLREHRGGPFGHEERGRGHRPLVEQAVAGLQLRARATARTRSWSATEKLSSTSTVIASTFFPPAPTVCIPTERST